MGVTQAGEQARLLLEAVSDARSGRHCFRQHFDRHRTPQVVVKAAVDPRHATAAKQRLDLVGAEPCADEIVGCYFWYQTITSLKTEVASCGPLPYAMTLSPPFIQHISSHN